MLQVGDGVKKWAVLVPTAVLPRPWRVAARKEALARLEVGKALRTGLLIGRGLAVRAGEPFRPARSTAPDDLPLVVARIRALLRPA